MTEVAATYWWQLCVSFYSYLLVKQTIPQEWPPYWYKNAMRPNALLGSLR